MSVMLTLCPECEGVGELVDAEGFAGPCGVCIGDGLIWPNTYPKPAWLDGRFMDHSHYDHTCRTCALPPAIAPVDGCICGQPDAPAFDHHRGCPRSRGDV